MALSREELAARLIELREEHDPPLKQSEAAKLVGMSLRRYAALERQESDPRLTTITKIAAGYGIDPQRLLLGQPASPAGQLTLRDFARLEAKINLLLEHHKLLTDDLGDMELPPELQPPAAPPAAPPGRRRRPS